MVESTDKGVLRLRRLSPHFAQDESGFRMARESLLRAQIAKRKFPSHLLSARMASGNTIECLPGNSPRSAEVTLDYACNHLILLPMKTASGEHWSTSG
jgi:hypothetical protein